MVNAAERADARCPGALHAVVARDGLLARIRIPGGLLGADGLAALADAAERFADGDIDCTARASVQLRGVRAVAELGAHLVRAGLVPSLEHDRVRNIVASPFAGGDPTELLDTRPLVRALDAAITADSALAELPAKFAIAIDGGGRAFPTSRPDILLRAARTSSGVRFAIVLAGDATAVATCEPDAACARIVAIAKAALRAALAYGEPETWRLASSSAAAVAARAAAAPSASSELPAAANSRREYPVPVGVFVERNPAARTLVPSVRLGRLTVPQARGVAAAARAAGADVRLGWWRGLTLTGIPSGAVAAMIASLRSVGIACDDADGFVGIAACAGSYGCDASLADVRADAVRLAQSVARHGTAGWTANLAGCAKRCAMRRGAGVDLVATDRGYDILRAGVRVRKNVAAVDALAYAATTTHEGPAPA